jgi:uncharacterized protein with PQ loop repeat
LLWIGHFSANQIFFLYKRLTTNAVVSQVFLFINVALFFYFQASGIKVIPVTPSPRLAKKMEDNGADAVVVEGLESGGHIGESTTFCLIPQAKKLLKKKQKKLV